MITSYKNLDRIIVHANLNYYEKEYVKLLGEVNVPGSYPLLKDNESIRSLVNRAGGFSSKSFIEGIEVYRDSMRVAWNNLSIPLMPGDSIVVKEKPGTVLVKGEVYNPGYIEFSENKKFIDYLNSAGGPTKKGDKNDILIVYANGQIAPKGRFISPPIRDGSTIIVNEKEISEPFNPSEFISTVLSFISSLITLIILSKQL